VSEVSITGMGVVSAIGVGRDKFAAALKARRCGISEVTGFDAEGCRCLLAAEVVDFDVEAFLESRKNYLDRNTELAFGAARLALDDSRLRISEENAERIGLSIGTAFGNVESVLTFHRQLVEKGARLVSPFIFPHTYNNTTASLLAIEYNLKGVHANFSSGSAAGAEAIAYAYENIKVGRADAILAGGVEALTEPVFRFLDSQSLPNPSGEGAGMVVLESAEYARRRGAPGGTTLTSCVVACDARSALEKAKEAAGISDEQIGLLIDASPFPGDWDGLNVFDLQQLTGHTIAASFPLALVACALMLPESGFAAVVAGCSGAAGVACILQGG